MILLVFTGKKEFDSEAERKTHTRNTRKNSTMGPLWEQGEREEQSGGRDGNLEAVEEEKEDEEVDSRETFEFRDNPRKVTTEGTVKAKKKKRKDVEEASAPQA